MTRCPSGRDASPQASALFATWDAWNRLTSVTSVTSVVKYSYDGDWKRIKKTLADNSSQDYYYDDMQLAEIRQYGQSGQPTQTEQFVYDTRYLHSVACRDILAPNGTRITRHYLLNDANFNVTALVSTNGTIVERYTYDPYGAVTIRDASWQPITWDSSTKNIILYTGHKYDSETGFYYSLYRYYHPQLGRWLTRDPLTQTNPLSSTTSSSTERSLCYQFVKNSPQNANDVLGLLTKYFNPQFDVEFKRKKKIIKHTILLLGTLEVNKTTDCALWRTRTPTIKIVVQLERSDSPGMKASWNNTLLDFTGGSTSSLHTSPDGWHYPNLPAVFMYIPGGNAYGGDGNDFGVVRVQNIEQTDEGWTSKWNPISSKSTLTKRQDTATSDPITTTLCCCKQGTIKVQVFFADRGWNQGFPNDQIAAELLFDWNCPPSGTCIIDNARIVSPRPRYVPDVAAFLVRNFFKGRYHKDIPTVNACKNKEL